jgi:hypothetical protein
MTVSLAWVRKVGPGEQLWFVSDSRLSGGRSWDYCSKILPLSRLDSAISFAGATDDAYPLMIQCVLAVDYHAPARERAADVPELKTHVLRVFNSMAEAIQSESTDLKDPRTPSIFGGYSWKQKRFVIWEIFYNITKRVFEARPARCVVFDAKAKRFVLAGKKRVCREKRTLIASGGDRDKRREAEQRLLQLLTHRREETETTEPFQFDMEPFEVVRDMLRESKSRKYDTIGGAPQLVRIDQHVNARAVGVYWPNRDSGQATLLGRPALGYENLDAWVLDPETLKLHHPHCNPVEENLDGNLNNEE